MPRGGARVRSGPPSSPDAIRRGKNPDRSGFAHLPSSGREGPAPAWPLPGRTTRFEREQWSAAWGRPQAIMWEQLGLEVQVALYIRTLRDATRSGAGATRTTALLRQIDSLGLSVAGLRANRWVIDEGQPAPAAALRPADASVKDRLSVITGGSNARAS